ncbi:MAG: ABC transporter permease [Lentisphaeraceae bacterium]|nr:ABC transporter permease [Lentisphaeraceae bacterium]
MKEMLKKRLSLLLPFIGLIFVLLVFLIFISVKDPDKLDIFFSMKNFQTVFKQSVIVGIAALGMTLVIISGGIDLSAGSTLAVGSVSCALVLKTAENGVVTPGLMVLACLAAVVSCALCGFLNGALIAKFKYMPFIVTLGTMQVFRGVAELLANNERVRTPTNTLQTFMNPFPDATWQLFAPGVWIMIVLTIIAAIILRYTVFGRYVYAIGSNEDTARLCGISIEKYKIVIYMLCGAFIGIAASMDYANLGSGNPNGALGLELNIIAAVLIGGASLDGGEGSALGSIVGAVIMAVLVNGCTLMNISPSYQKMIIGAIIIVAVGIDKLKHRITA